MSKKYLMFDLDDPKIGDLADVLSNKTSKRIIEHLAEKESSEAEIAKDLEIPANTVNYNIQKLLTAGLIEKTKTYFWSVKGKKIPNYRVANKKIIISPKSFKNMKNLLMSLVATGAVAVLIKMNNFGVSQNLATQTSGQEIDYASKFAIASPEMGNSVVTQAQSNPLIWGWFLLGGIIALFIFMILNWREV